MIDKIKASIIIPNLNSAIIGKTIASIQNQEFENEKEIIVVGQDRSRLMDNLEIVKFFETSSPVIPAVARNIGSKMAKGEILIFVDADCIALPGWLFSLISVFANPKVNVVGGSVKLLRGNYWTTADNISMFHDYLDTHQSGIRDLLASINLAVRRDVFINIGGFDETRPMGEDSDLSIRIRRSGQKLYFQPEASVIHIPTRTRFLEMVIHHYQHGQYSVKVDPVYSDEPGIPRPLRKRVWILLVSPIIAFGSTIFIFIKTPGIISYFYTIPAVFISKLSWCLGAATRRRQS